MRTIPVMQGDTLLEAVRAASRAGTYDKDTKTLHIPFAAWVRVIDAAAAEETREPEKEQNDDCRTDGRISVHGSGIGTTARLGEDR